MNGSLFLTPENPASSFDDMNALKTALLEINLIQPGDSNQYLCGEKFAQLITFMGCSPHLVFEQPADGSDHYCHIRLHQYREIQLFTGQQTAPPRCPKCRHRIADWRTYAEDWQKQGHNAHWSCPGCETTSPVYQLDWRQSGGSGKVLIEIRNIFPGEAVPVDQLMATLKTVSGEKWRYFYLV